MNKYIHSKDALMIYNERQNMTANWVIERISIAIRDIATYKKCAYFTYNNKFPYYRMDEPELVELIIKKLKSMGYAVAHFPAKFWSKSHTAYCLPESDTKDWCWASNGTTTWMSPYFYISWEKENAVS